MNIWLSKITLLVLSVYLLAGCAEKYELDRQMEELCKKDGGAKIYETVKLSPEFFEANGLIKNKEYSREGNKTYLKIATDFILINEIIYIKEGDPLKGQGMLLRSKSELRRISDNSLLAEEVKYGRSGGDIWFFNLPTQASCPSKPIDIVNEVFKK
jgi:hypothetical protein